MGAGAGTRRRGESGVLAALAASRHCRATSTGARPQVSLFRLVGVRPVRGEVRHLRGDEVRLLHLAHAWRRRSARTRSGSRARSSRRCCSPPSSATCSPRKASRCSSRKSRGCSPSTAGHRKPDLAQATARLQVVEQEIAHIMDGDQGGHFHGDDEGGTGDRPKPNGRGCCQTVQGRPSGSTRW